MFENNYLEPSKNCWMVGPDVVSGWRPPSGPVLTALMGLTISVYMAARMAMEVPRSGDIGALLASGRHALLAASLLFASIKRG